MAPTADDPERITLALRSIAAMLDELRSLAAEWGTLSQDERLAWSLEWGNEMAKLRQLAEADQSGRLDADQRREVHALAERVVLALRQVDKLNLRPPDDSIRLLARISA